MRSVSSVVALAIALALPCGPSRGDAAEDDWLIRADRVYPVAGSPIDDGVIRVHGGRIVEVREARDVDPGARPARVLRVRGSVTPGFVDCGSSIGIVGRAAEEWEELTPAMHVADSVDLDHPELQRALESGVTTVAVSPGGRNVIGGLGAVIRRGPVDTRAEGAVLREGAFLAVSLLEEAASGNRSLRGTQPRTQYYRLPTTRMGTNFLVRRAFYEALGFPAPSEDGSVEDLDTDGSPPEGVLDVSRLDEVGLRAMLDDDGRDTLRRALRADLPLRFLADERQEVLTALRILQEFRAKASIEGAGEVLNVIPELVRAGAPVLLRPGAEPRHTRPDAYPDASPRISALLQSAGVPFAYASGAGDDVPRLRTRVALSLRFGLSEDAALRALTLQAAAILGVDDRTGSLEPEKEADIVAFSGPPLDLRSRVLWVMTEGRLLLVDDEAEAEAEPETTQEPES